MIALGVPALSSTLLKKNRNCAAPLRVAATLRAFYEAWSLAT